MEHNCVQLVTLLVAFVLSFVPFVNCSFSSFEPLTKELFLSRCNNYDYISVQRIRCDSLWEDFLVAFQCPFSDCTYVSDQKKYEDFVSLIPPTTPSNKTMFFSGGTKDAAYNIGTKCVDKNTIQTTLLGQIFDDVSWCCARNGQLDDHCSQNQTCTTQTGRLFWSQASHVFAQNATGYTVVTLNGSSDNQPYPVNSIFTTVEVPSLTSNVISMTAIIAYDKDNEGDFKQRWRCNSQGSRLSDLEADLVNKGIRYNCTDDIWFSSDACNSATISKLSVSSIILLLITLYQNLST